MLFGVCAMNKKTFSAPMQNILTRLRQQDYIQLIIFTDHTILNEPVEAWPVCHCLIAFFSEGFPLEKAIRYTELRRPMLLNDLQMQYELMDRRRVYEILEKNGIDVPIHVVLERRGGLEDEEELVENDDIIEVKGQVFHKPFVEKPVSAEDHHIYIYFPSDYGGGCQRLFRKINNRSSTYSRESSVRKQGSFIYEEFLATDGTDVKVYTVGPDYAHAEARKSPSLDGKVERDKDGKEKRHPVILTAKEKLIARQVCLAFKQTVCGFDMLRANGKSYVCDVNGFSFVKNSQKYYDDCSQIILEMITAQLAPEHFPLIPPSVEYLAEEVPVPILATGNMLELRCVIGVIRHGDRTPKQKMKMVVTHTKFFDLFEELDGYKKGHLKIKKPKLLQRVLDISRYLLDNVEKYHKAHEINEKVNKLQQLKSVLEMYGHFSGINRKVQFRLLNRNPPALLLILKWGGELTKMGEKQAEELGRAFRCMYPGGEGEYASLPGSGFLRLHSTYRHDLKVYASDEGRVQMTAAAFTMGLLDLEGSLASTAVHLVKRDQSATNMLDTSNNAEGLMNSVKERLHDLLSSSEDVDGEVMEALAPTKAVPLVDALRHIGNPREACERLYQLICSLLEETRTVAASGCKVELYHEETLEMMISRWEKLVKDFKSVDGKFNISKIPDIYDCIKYDLIHNHHSVHCSTGGDLLEEAMHLADVVIPQEYGLTRNEKFDIATKICLPLLYKMQSDLHHTIVNEHSDIIHRLDPRLSRNVGSPNRHVRTRLYFTSESHVHSMLNILCYGGLVKQASADPSWEQSMEQIALHPELNYLTQIVVLLFEDMSQPEGSDTRYCVDLLFSPGVKRCHDVASLSEPTKSASTSSLLKGSPELKRKSLATHWVKRLPPISVKRGLEDDTQASTVSSVLVASHFGPEPHGVPRSLSDSCVTERMPSTGGRAPTSDVALSCSPDFAPDLLVAGLDHHHLSDDMETQSLEPPDEEGVAKFILLDEPIHDELDADTAGLEMAAELASSMTPLTKLCSMSLKQINRFFTSLTSISLDYTSINPRVPPRPPPRTPSRTPTPASPSVPDSCLFFPLLKTNGKHK